MRVSLKPVRVFNVTGPTGRLERMRQVGNEWNGLVEMQCADGKKLILMREGGAMSQAISGALGDGTSDWDVVQGAPALPQKLGFLSPVTSQSGADAVQSAIKENDKQFVDMLQRSGVALT